ncbi:acetate--CoA ligase [Phaeacidiphilus oryzae]|uniref:acetate--CoA ligase n=1 Tax=Phaeacidiphilus oryzae TaxID=348818 RepID=UPI000565AD30|nr:acetate--CoA ligase [Phaeacidiphilus oryzae]
MPWPTVRKSTPRVPPNLADYEAARSTFSWREARARLAGLPEGRGLNIAHEAADRQVAAGHGDRVALRFVPAGEATLPTVDLTYAQLTALSSRFAHVLAGLGVARGERVATLLGRCPELYTAALGTWKRAAVLCPLFSAFGPRPILDRLRLGDVSVLVTTAELHRRRVAALRSELPALRHVLLIDPPADADPAGAPPDTLGLPALMAAAPDRPYPIPPTDPEDMALLHFTSGTTGTPKAAVHVHAAVVAHRETAASALDLHPGDVYWCTADPGWVTGTSYGVIAPLAHGVTSVVDTGEFGARRWYRILAEQRVSVWYTAPTALRMLMRTPPAVADEYDLSALRHIASVGEPLNPEVVLWAERTLGVPVHDTWWQTETGAIMIGNLASAEIRPGSMGRPLPGVEATVLRRGRDGRARVDDHGKVTPVHVPGAEGELALRAGRPAIPSMFRGYLHDDKRYADCFADGWYLTGDLVRRDADGWFWFVGRADDVIKTAGHLIGPFEVESVLMEHPAVAEAGVIGKPDPVAGNIVKAFVSLRDGFTPGPELTRDLTAFARARLGSTAAPREFDYDQHLPHTRSGKVMRRLLRARELGAPEGDVSTLETAPETAPEAESTIP